MRQARLRKGLSQEKAAQMVGCSRLQWINWEQGRHRPQQHLVALVEVIGVDGDKLSAADDGDLDQDALMTPLMRAVGALIDKQVDRRIERLRRAGELSPEWSGLVATTASQEGRQ